MSQFSADWLRQRAPFDAAARGAPPAMALARWFCDAFDGQPIRLADLGGGMGANVAALAPLIGCAQHWVVIDNDAALLGHADALRLANVTVATRRADLADLDTLDLEAIDAVTGSAILDLVSAAWIDRLVSVCAARRCRAYFTLTVDGRLRWTPAHDDDALIVASFRRDQGRDKGIGAAIGPAAGAYLARRLTESGARVATARCDWRIEPADHAMLGAMIDHVALASEPDRRGVDDWAVCRGRQAVRGELSLTVGHMDVAALW